MHMVEAQQVVVDQAKRFNLYELALEARLAYLQSEVEEVVQAIQDPHFTNADVGEELADILWNCFVIAEMRGLELSTELSLKMRKLEKRWNISQPEGGTI